MRALTIGLLALALGGAGCGGDDDSTDSAGGDLPDSRVGGADGATSDGAVGDDGPALGSDAPFDGAEADAARAVDGIPLALDGFPSLPIDALITLPLPDARSRPDADLSPDARIAPPLLDAPTTRDLDFDGHVTINEVMAFNADTVADETGAHPDWVELYNPTDHAVPLGGYAMSDAVAIPRRAVLPDGLVVPARGYLVLWLDHLPALGAAHVAFKLRREGGDLVLERPDGTPIDRIRYGAQEVDFSAAREPDGSNHWAIEWHATPGGANPSGTGAAMGLEDPAASPENVPAAGDLSQRILGYDAFPSLEIVISAANMAALASAPRVDVPAEIVFEGRSYGPVGVRLKGQNSFQPITQKPSLKINMDQYVPRAKFFGLKDLTLNNMDNDLSMMHERLAYLVARQAGVPASRATHARVSVNGTSYGLYTALESVKHVMMSRWFADDTGSIFEGTDCDFTAGYVDDFEHESGVDDRTPLSGLAAALANPDADAAITAAGAYVDIAAFQRFWAMETVIGQFDASPYSTPGDDYLLYVDPASDRLRFVPWGMDESFYSSSFDVTDVTSILANKCLDSTTCFQGYVDACWDILAITESMDLDDERARVVAQIASAVTADTKKPYTTDEVHGSQDAMHWFISERRTRLTAMLPPPSP